MKINFVRIITVNVVPDSQRCQLVNPHLTVQHISSYRYSAQVKKAHPYYCTFPLSFTIPRLAARTTHTHTQRTASSARCSPNRYLHHSRVQYTARVGDIVHTHATSHDLSRRSQPSPAPLPTPHMLPITPTTPHRQYTGSRGSLRGPLQPNKPNLRRHTANMTRR